METYAEQSDDGHVFVGPKGAKLSGCHFQDLRHTGNTPGIEPELSAWEWATDLAVLSWGNGEQVKAGRVAGSPCDSPLITVRSGMHLARSDRDHFPNGAIDSAAKGRLPVSTSCWFVSEGSCGDDVITN
ncbi:hypothetical protein ACWEJ6_35215 [Nonomuraea sp. NPDC004702]